MSDEPTVCPKCGSSDVTLFESSEGGTVGVGDPLIPQGRTFSEARCNVCGHTFGEAPRLREGG